MKIPFSVARIALAMSGVRILITRVVFCQSLGHRGWKPLDSTNFADELH